MKVGRNDPCPCGSGQRYKNCHAEKDRGMHRSGWIAIVVAGVAVVSLIALAMAYRKGPGPANPAGGTMSGGAAPSGGVSTTPSAAQPVGTPGAAAPPGPPPPGKVWSAEHGHWHDAPMAPSTTTIPMGGPLATSPGVTTTTPASPATGQMTPQPPGPVPPGKVWSAEHGHWHDAPPGTGGQ